MLFTYVTILDITHRPVFYLKPTSYVLGPTQEAQPEEGNRILFPKRRVLNKRQEDG
jgi:hypothetical protein